MAKIIKYSENPSIHQAMLNTKKGAKVIFGKNSQTEIEIYEVNGEDSQTLALDFITKKIVDKDQFIKLYIHSFPVLAELKNSTKLLFQYILSEVSSKVNIDEYFICYAYYKSKCEENPLTPIISQPTFSRAINELLESEIIYKSTKSNHYFINIAYIFNGDRLRFITEYQAKKLDKNKGE